MQQKPLIIIGAGLGGYMFAKEWRKLDQTTPLVIITADAGDFYSKPLLSTALTQEKTAATLVVSDAATMAQQLDASIHTFATVTTIDAKQQTLQYLTQDQQVHTLDYSKLVLAVGANKMQVPLAGDAVGDIMSVNNLLEYAAFRQQLAGKKELAIIGAGLVGCEFANDLLNTQHSLQMIALEQYPLAKFVPEMVARALIAPFAEHGVQWHLGRMVTAVNKKANQYVVLMDDHRELLVDGVFAAVGLRPNIDLAKAAGLQTHQGIVVDTYLQTSSPNIYALGDCAEVDGEIRQYVAPLLQCARTLAKNLASDSTQQAVVYPCMPIVIKTPLCPVVSCLPPSNVAGQWQHEGEGSNQRAVFLDDDEQVWGFALSGDKVREKASLVKAINTAKLASPSR